MQTKCYDNKQTPKNEKRLPCSKNCGCYLSQAVSDLKRDISMRCKAIMKLTSGPALSMKLSTSERRLLSLTPSGGPSSLVCCLAIRELATRENDLANINKDQSRIASEVDRLAALSDTLCNRLLGAKAVITSLESTIIPCGQDDNEEINGKTIEGIKILEYSKERRRKMKEIFDPVSRNFQSEEDAVCHFLAFAKDRDLNRAALKSALQALVRLASEVGCQKHYESKV